MLHRLPKYTLVVLLLTMMAVSAAAQMGTPPPETGLYYRLLRIASDDKATDTRWIEMWERVDTENNRREVILLEARAGANGVEDSCQYVRVSPDEPALQLADGVRQPVFDAANVFNTLPNARVFGQYNQFVSFISACGQTGSGTVNSVNAEQCGFEGVDASNLFLIRPPATANGARWAAPNGQPVSYRMEVDGDDSTVLSRYEYIPSQVNIASTSSQSELQMACMNIPLPLPEGSTLLAQNGDTYAVFDSSVSLPDLRAHHEDRLTSEEYQNPVVWRAEAIDDERQQSFVRSMPDGSQCRLEINYTPTDGGGPTAYDITVRPGFTQAANLLAGAPAAEEPAEGEITEEAEATEEPETTAVTALSATNANATVPGGVQDALDLYLPRYIAEGWVLREDLTDQREDSAFVTLSRDNYEMHIMVEALVGSSIVRIQTRTAACGPTFSPPVFTSN